MKRFQIARRRMMAMVGASVVLAPALGAAASTTPAGTSTRIVDAGAELLAPLTKGSTIGQWRVENICTRCGAIAVDLRGPSGALFTLDICVRDDGAPNPPIRTDKFDVFVSNHGDGALPTRQDQGLAAFAVAEIVRANEHRVRTQGLLSHRDRLQLHSDELLSHS